MESNKEVESFPWNTTLCIPIDALPWINERMGDGRCLFFLLTLALFNSIIKPVSKFMPWGVVECSLTLMLFDL